VRSAVTSAALLLTVLGCAANPGVPRYELRLAGAHIPAELVDSWLAADEDARFVIERVPPWEYSRAGFEHLVLGTCDLACTDRPPSAAEREQFTDAPLAGGPVGFYGFALYVHPDNPLDNVFAGHVTLLFQRKLTDWSELSDRAVPGLSGPIRLIGPAKATRGGEVLARQARIWFADPTWEVRESDAKIAAAVAGDSTALGFASIGYDQGVRALGLRMDISGPPAFPSREEILSERYGLAKVIYVFHRDPPSPAVQAACDFLYSRDGERAIESTAVWPVAREQAVATSP